MTPGSSSPVLPATPLSFTQLSTRHSHMHVQQPYHMNIGNTYLFLRGRGCTMQHVGSWFPDQGWNLCTLHLKCGVLTTGLPEKSQHLTLFSPPLHQQGLIVMAHSSDNKNKESMVRQQWQKKKWKRNPAIFIFQMAIQLFQCFTNKLRFCIVL